MGKSKKRCAFFCTFSCLFVWTPNTLSVLWLSSCCLLYLLIEGVQYSIGLGLALFSVSVLFCLLSVSVFRFLFRFWLLVLFCFSFFYCFHLLLQFCFVVVPSFLFCFAVFFYYYFITVGSLAYKSACLCLCFFCVFHILCWFALNRPTKRSC